MTARAQGRPSAGVDPATARYVVAMFGNAEAGEGIGNVRPVYDGAYWNSRPTRPGSRNSASAAEPVSSTAPSRPGTRDTGDPNALDVLVGEGQTQAAVLDWRAGSPVVVPMLGLQP